LATSKRRDSVFISTAQRDRARARRAAAAAAKSAAGGTRRGKPGSEAHALAEAKRVQRERRNAGQRRARRLRLIAVAVAILLVVVACVAIYDSPLFTITSVEVVATPHNPAGTIRALARVPADATLIRFPADAVAARVAVDPWVALVSVTRVFPSGMRIRVTERVPVAVVQSGTSQWFVDATGMIVATASVGATATMPAIQGVPGLDPRPGRRTSSEALLNAVAILAGISQQLRSMVVSVWAPTIDDAKLTTAGNVDIVIGQAVSLATKDQLALRILAEQKGKVVSIDVRVIDRPTWRGLK
jgi:cell division protein FtsQ